MEQDQAMGVGESPVLDSRGYVLRENPKKSRKFSDISHNVDGVSMVRGKKVQCTVCGKEFASSFSLNGHLRHHSGEEMNCFRCDLCGRRFQSVRGLNGHMRMHSGRQSVCAESGISPTHSSPIAAAVSDAETNLVRKKRSKRTWYKFMGSSSDISGFTESVSGYEYEYEYEYEFEHVEEEVAESLLLLSSGAGLAGWSTFISDSLDNASTSVSVEDCSLPDEGGVDVYDDNENVEMEKVKEGQSGSFADSEMVVDECDQTSCDKREVLSLEAQLDSVSELASGVGEEGIGFRCEVNREGGNDVTGLGYMNSISSCDVEIEKNVCDRKIENSPPNSVGKIADSSGSLKFKCKICNKMFATPQSLGGHQTSHRMTKCSISVDTEVCVYSSIVQPDIVLQVKAESRTVRLECAEAPMEREMDGPKEVHDRVSTTKEFKCSICCKIFTSGQALGGHKRAHWASRARGAMEHDVSDNASELTDLDIPCLVDSKANHDTQLTPSWAGTTCKHEAPVGIIGS